MNQTFGLPPLVLLAASIACTDPPPPLVGALLRDSAGIQIVESQGPGDSIRQWRLEQSAALSIGLVDGDPAYLLNGVGDAVQLEDGTIAFANSGTELRFYTREGKHLRTSGRRGEGPGEFLSIAGVVFARDTLFAFDQRSQKVVFFDRRGAFVGELPKFATLRRMSPAPLRLAAALEDGRFLFVTAGSAVPRRDSVQLYRLALPNIAISRDGLRADTVAMSMRDWLTGNQQVMIPPFGRASAVAANAGVMVVTHGARYEAEVRNSSTGALLRLIRLQQSPPALERAEFDRALEQRVDDEIRAQAGEEVAPDALAAGRLRLAPLVRAMEPYPNKPAWSALLLDARGYLWAQDFGSREDTVRHYTVFDTSGRLVARAELPASVSVRQIGSDVVLGVRSNELGVQSVVLFRLRRE